ncbi:MAG: FAD-dependent oxidoreductase [Dehalococcoidales bacterium]|nr:FAD-dependent oxidoreductase [Dehalococcoidales bacterium]
MEFRMLMSPVNIGSMQLKNRLVVPAMGTDYANADSSVSRQHTDYWLARARGGFGLLIVEVTAVDPGGKGSPRQPGIWDDSFIRGWKEFTDRLHQEGAKVAVQLHHAGRQTMSAITGSQPIAPSPVACPVEKEVPRELTTAEVYSFIEKFGDGARRAKEAGFDAVEVHGAHGYLVAQFMSGLANKRLDEFGGPFINRMRFPLEIIKNIRRKTGESFPIIFRISADERVAGGRTIEESQAAARLLEEAGVNAIHVSTSTYESIHWVSAPSIVPMGFLSEDAAAIKKAVKVPVIAVGRLHDPVLAESLLATGAADLVSEGRQSLTDPEFPNKIAAGQLEDIAPCISCLQGCLGYLFNPAKGQVSCLVNPFCGQEGTMKIEKTPSPKKVMVVGGGPGGLEAARILAQRGHQVTLYEKGNTLGGAYRVAAVSPGKQDILKALRYYIHMGEKHGVNFKLGTEVTASLVEQERPDVVVLATGSRPFVPDIPGIKKPGILLATDLLEGKKTCSEVNNKVLIVGGGFVGAETADFLADYGYDITIIDMVSDIATEEQGSVRYFLMERLKEHNVKTVLNAKVTEFLDDGVVYQQDNQEQRLTGFGTVVLATGYRAYNPLETALKGKVKELHVIGDAVEARKAIDAIAEGARVGIAV